MVFPLALAVYDGAGGRLAFLASLTVRLPKKLKKDKAYTLADAIKLATETNPSKFDASVEIHVHLGVDPRQADQNIRSTVVLPHGTGKTIQIAVFAADTDADKAKKTPESSRLRGGVA